MESRTWVKQSFESHPGNAVSRMLELEYWKWLDFRTRVLLTMWLEEDVFLDLPANLLSGAFMIELNTINPNVNSFVHSRTLQQN